MFPEIESMGIHKMREWRSDSPEELMEIGKVFVLELQKNSVVCLFGDLGAGKTTFVKGMAAGLGLSPDHVQSPTFTYLNIYESAIPLYHFDLYRLHTPEEFLAMGFDDYLYGDGICCIEWSERIQHLLPMKRYDVLITSPNPCSRQLRIHTRYD